MTAGQPTSSKFKICLALLGTLVVLCACGSLGPRTMDKDQLDYGRSIGDNWKNQLLANLVKIRFIDMPVFVDVGQIVSGYSLETQLSGTAGFGNTLGGGDSQVLGASGKYTDRPTITYTPKTGEAYLRSLLEPIEPTTILSLVLTGYNPELLFTWAVESINGVNNYSSRAQGQHVANPEFYEFIGLLSELQENGAIGFEINQDTETEREMVLFFDDRNINEVNLRKRERMREILGANSSARKFPIIYSPFAVDDKSLAMQTRSILQVMISMSTFVDVPPDKADRASGGFDRSSLSHQPFHVRTSKEKPEDVYASFHYQGDWYWIPHNDLETKRVFSLMLFLTTLTNRAGTENAPVLTIPTQ
ncbi:MAG TPA: hypothetical protein VFG52_12580 [Xanthomonadales bacterium]|nr:hypothetical protein [Xanthomonadales bacterium]